MKKQILYIAMFLMGILIGSSVFEAYSNKKPSVEKKPTNLYAMNSPVEERPTDFIQSISGKLGKTLVINGRIKEAYKNKENELVLYIDDRNIPLNLNCTLIQSDLQVKYAIRLGERISLKGKFTEIGDEMYLENCRILHRSQE